MIAPSKWSFAGELDGARLRRALKACPGRPEEPAPLESRGDGGSPPSSTPHTHVARSRSVAAQGEER